MVWLYAALGGVCSALAGAAWNHDAFGLALILGWAGVKFLNECWEEL